MDKKLLEAAGGQAPADIVVKNGKLVNVYTKEIYEGGVAISGDKIAAVGDVEYAIGEGTKVIDAGGNYITPGFIDGHIHPESSSRSIRSFAELVLKHGTTAVMTDLHEIGVVAGLEGIEAVLEEAEVTDLKLYFVVPSHVPFAPNLETSGGHFNPEIIKKSGPYEAEEGCLSLTGTRKAKRWQSIKVQYQNERFQTRFKTFTGWTAQIIQHEIDHCEGILI